MTPQPEVWPHDARPHDIWTVDGIEQTPSGPVARLERADGTTFDLPLTQLPSGLKEGDLLAVQDGPDGAVAWILTGETQARRQAMQARLDALNTPAEGDRTISRETTSGEITL